MFLMISVFVAVLTFEILGYLYWRSLDRSYDRVTSKRGQAILKMRDGGRMVGSFDRLGTN